MAVLVVGLGNPGEKYQQTRHNVGFMVVEALAKKMGSSDGEVWQQNKKCSCETIKVGEIVLAKPTTYMNDSGKAVAALLRFYKIDPLALYVVHDEVDLPLGKMKIVADRGAAGHHGVESIIKEIGGKNFVRVRVGVGYGGYEDERGFRGKTRATVNYILGRFTSSDEGKIKIAIKKAVEALEVIQKNGVDKAMETYNR